MHLESGLGPVSLRSHTHAVYGNVTVGITLAALVTIALVLRAPPSVDGEPAATQPASSEAR